MSLRERIRAFMRALILLSLLLVPVLAQADEPTITITVGDNKRSFTRGALLASRTPQQSKWREISPIACRCLIAPCRLHLCSPE